MSKKTTSLIIAALALAVSASSAFAGDTTQDGRKAARTHQQIPYNARASAQVRPSAEWPYGAREPFTAAEKRAFQTPTGQEVDRW